MTTLTITTDILEYARELRDRFPDLPDGEMRLAFEEYVGRRLPEYVHRALEWEYINQGVGRNPWL